MSSSEYNPSADLRFLYLVKKSIQQHGVSVGYGECGPADLEKEAFEYIPFIMDRVSYGVGLKPGQAKYGTKPIKKSGMPDDINNVNDAEDILRHILTTNVALRALNEAYYEDWEKLCDIHVFSDGVTNMKVRMA